MSGTTKMLWFLSGAVVLLIGLSAFGWYYLAGPGYYAERDAIRSELEQIPGVEVLELAGVHDDDIPFLPRYHRISARIQVEGGGELHFSNLEVNSVRGRGPLLLVSAGPYRIRVRGEGMMGASKIATGEPVRSEFAGGPVNIAPDGAFARFFPFEVQNVEDAVTRYDEIVKVMASWPETPRKPQHFRDDRETDYFFWVTTKGIDDPDPLWQATLDELRTP